ncbi:MAG: flagellum-specific ATP synthase FliI, partial [Rubrivivax sp.]
VGSKSERADRARDLIQLGAYAPGHDNELDIAVQVQPQIIALLQQDMLEPAPLQDCQRRLMTLAA